MDVGEVAGCYCLTADCLTLDSFVEDCRSLLIGRVVWISAFDGGPMRLSPGEVERGWSACAGLAVSPPVEASTALPYDNYDEWWIDVAHDPPLRGLTFVNDGGFRLAGLERMKREAHPTWDVRDVHDHIASQQQQFWTAFWASGAEMFVSCNGLFNFAARDSATVERVAGSARRWS